MNALGGLDPDTSREQTRLYGDAEGMGRELTSHKDELLALERLPVRSHYLQSMEQHNQYGARPAAFPKLITPPRSTTRLAWPPLQRTSTPPPCTHPSPPQPALTGPFVAAGDIVDDFIEAGSTTVLVDMLAAPTGSDDNVGNRLLFKGNRGFMAMDALRNCFALGRRKAEVVTVGRPDQLGEYGVGLKRAIAILGASGLVFTGSSRLGFINVGLLSTRQWQCTEQVRRSSSRRTNNPRRFAHPHVSFAAANRHASGRLSSPAASHHLASRRATTPTSFS